MVNNYYLVLLPMKKKERAKRGDGVVATIFLFGKYLQAVNAKQADFQIKNSKHLSRERAILKLIAGE